MSDKKFLYLIIGGAGISILLVLAGQFINAWYGVGGC